MKMITGVRNSTSESDITWWHLNYEYVEVFSRLYARNNLEVYTAGETRDIWIYVTHYCSDSMFVAWYKTIKTQTPLRLYKIL
jgi:hypothetical protein